MLQMHPVLRHMKPTVSAATDLPPLNAPDEREPEEPVGLARVFSEPEHHPKVALKKDASEAYVPKQNVFRDPQPEAENMRHLQYASGSMMHLDKEKVLSGQDFETPEGQVISPARAHLQAARLATAYEQTLKQEVNFQKSFNNQLRVLISREEVTMGLMHLWDFVTAYVENPTSKSLATQLLLIVQHARDESMFKEALLNVAEPEGKWLLDLLNITQTIIVQERQLQVEEKIAAINYSITTLSRYYAGKIFKTPFVPMDKEVKICTFYMRMVIKLLTLSDELGVYRTEKMQRAVSSSRKREMSDKELMFNLYQALTTPEEQGAPCYTPRPGFLQTEDDSDEGF